MNPKHGPSARLIAEPPNTELWNGGTASGGLPFTDWLAGCQSSDPSAFAGINCLVAAVSLVKFETSPAHPNPGPRTVFLNRC